MTPRQTQSIRDFDSVAARLIRRAKQLAERHGENRLRERRGDSWRWRDARLLWPLFGKE